MEKRIRTYLYTGEGPEITVEPEENKGDEPIVPTPAVVPAVVPAVAPALPSGDSESVKKKMIMVMMISKHLK